MENKPPPSPEPVLALGIELERLWRALNRLQDSLGNTVEMLDILDSRLRTLEQRAKIRSIPPQDDTPA